MGITFVCIKDKGFWMHYDILEVWLCFLSLHIADTQFAVFLCSDVADCFVGQVFLVSGGWVIR